MLLDYVRQYGDVPFAESKPNALDLLALAEMSNFEYASNTADLPMAQAVDMAVLPTITDAGNTTIVALDNKEDLDLAQLVKTAKRYEDVTLLDFDSHYVEGGQQFGAIAVRAAGALCVAFRATDLTVTGWQESLELSRDVPTGSQVDAAAFLKRAHRRWPGPLVVCGHSKGGNLAEYASRELVEEDPAAADDLVCIVSFDGPGLPPHYRDTDAYRRIAPLMHTFIPRSSIVGNIHEHAAGTVAYVDAVKPFVMQHYVYNWTTNGTHLVASRQSIVGKVASAALNLLIDVTDDAGKSRIFNMLFKPYRLLNKRLL
ncbi:MAG: Mbeg1-like protein [Bifidobacterium sp.]|nr:Mbeg1-like protein [Bifidobacterium sp.]